MEGPSCPGAWIEANRVVIERLLEPDNWRARIRAARDYASFDRTYQIDWLGGMCELVGVSPPCEEECFELANRATIAITSRVHSAFPGAANAIQTLYGQGYILHTASGEPSVALAGYLEGMGVRHCFDRLYGPDLLDTFKEGPEYYERLFADVGIAPADAIVVDDTPRVIDWAAQVGARTVLVGEAAYSMSQKTLHIASLAELPSLIQRMS